MSSAVPEIEIIVPVYKEPAEVVLSTVEALAEVRQQVAPRSLAVLIVNDGSGPEYDYRAVEGREGVRLLNLPQNRGYGGALKAGLQHSSAEWVGITDADGTYPHADFPKLIERLDFTDMAVGARITEVRHIPWLRRFPKWVLTRYASYLAGRTIPDLNSGMRVFSRTKCLELWPLYPDGFSFTSTITMGFMALGYRIDYVPINYFKREGSSTMRPIRDTRMFFQLVGRLGLYFRPLRIFAPLAAALLLAALLKGGRDYLEEGHLGNLSVSLGIGALQVYLMGLLGELIVRRHR